MDYPRDNIEVWILDGFSDDDTIQLAANFRVRLFQIEGNPAAAYNSVIGIVSAPIIALVDSDARVSKTWLKKLVLSLNLSQADAAGSRIGTWSGGSRLSRAIGEELDTRYAGLPSRVERLATTCMILKTETLRAMGGFDQALATGYDAALGYALNRSGKSIVFNSEAVVYQLHRRSLEGYIRQQFRYGDRDPAIAGDSVTSAWMTSQPILMLMLVLATCIFVTFPALTTYLAITMLFGSLLLIVTWTALAVKLSLRHRGVATFVMAMVVQLVRAEAWTLGIVAGLNDMVHSVLRIPKHR